MHIYDRTKTTRGGQEPGADFRGKNLTSYAGIDLRRVSGMRVVRSRSTCNKGHLRKIDEVFVEIKPEEKGEVPTMMTISDFRYEYEHVGGGAYKPNRFYAFAPVNPFTDSDGSAEVTYPARHVIVQDREGNHEVYSPEEFEKKFVKES